MTTYTTKESGTTSTATDCTDTAAVTGSTGSVVRATPKTTNNASDEDAAAAAAAAATSTRSLYCPCCCGGGGGGGGGGGTALPFQDNLFLPTSKMESSNSSVVVADDNSIRMLSPQEALDQLTKYAQQQQQQQQQVLPLFLVDTHNHAHFQRPQHVYDTTKTTTATTTTYGNHPLSIVSVTMAVEPADWSQAIAYATNAKTTATSNNDNDNNSTSNNTTNKDDNDTILNSTRFLGLGIHPWYVTTTTTTTNQAGTGGTTSTTDRNGNGNHYVGDTSTIEYTIPNNDNSSNRNLTVQQDSSTTKKEEDEKNDRYCDDDGNNNNNNYYYDTSWKDRLEQLLQHYSSSSSSSSIIVVVGEVGLDKMAKSARFHHRGKQYGYELQRQIFTEQLLLAAKYQRPVSMHCVQQHNVLLDILKRTFPAVINNTRSTNNNNGTGNTLPILPPTMAMHSFTGTEHHVKMLLQWEATMFGEGPNDRKKKKNQQHQEQERLPLLYFGFSHWINVRMCLSETVLNQQTRNVIRSIPRNRLLCESDVSHPSDVLPGTAGAVALLAWALQEPLIDIANLTTHNGLTFLLQHQSTNKQHNQQHNQQQQQQ